MSDYLFKDQFSCRLPKDDVNFLNENLHNLLPVASDGVKPTNTEVFLYLAETAISKKTASHHPDDVAKIEELEKALDHYKAMQSENVLNTERLFNELEASKDKLENLQVEIIEKDNAIQLLSTQCNELAADLEPMRNKVLSIEKPTKVILELTPAECEITEIIRQKVVAWKKEEKTTSRLLFDLFWKYIYDQEAQIAFPFFLSRKQIHQIIAKHQTPETEA